MCSENGLTQEEKLFKKYELVVKESGPGDASIITSPRG